jgi:hypothetical protein
MSRSLALFAVLTCGVAALGCSDRVEKAEKTYGGRGRVASTRGGPVVVTYDDRVAVVTNRSAGVIRVVHLNPSRGHDRLLGESFEFPVGVAARPWAAVIGADDNTAYVLLRGSERVVRITGLHEQPKLDEFGGVGVGTEPTDIAITPSGARLYVANWGEGTVSMINTTDLVAGQYTDLNFALAKTGALGPLTEEARADDPLWTDAQLKSVRPGLAHPRALAMTDNGDDVDEDEILYATEFFSQAIPGTTIATPDAQRQGFVYAISVKTGQLRQQEQNPIALAPVNTGIRDAEDGLTYCFPNQLEAAAIEGERLYVTSMCASPAGPVGAGPADAPDSNFRTLVHPAVFVIDTSPEGQREIPELGSVLTRTLSWAYTDDESLPRRYPLSPSDIAVVSGPRAYVTALGADALFPIDYSDLAVPDARFVDLRPADRLPIGVATSHGAGEPFALVLSDYSDALTVVSLVEGRAVARETSVDVGGGVDPDVREGRRLFATGLDIWSFQGLAHSSCESCHPDGLSDGVVWRFARGPRRTISTAGTYYPDRTTRRMLLWTANVDEIHDVEAIARGVSGGVGGVLWNTYTGEAIPNKDCRLLFDGVSAGPVGGVDDCPGPKSTTSRLNGLNGALGAITRATGEPPCPEDAPSCDVNSSQDWDHIDAFIRSLSAPKAPRRCDVGRSSFIERACLDADAVMRGADLFVRAQCGACHGGPGWTISRVFYTPSPDNNGALPPAKPAVDALDASGVMLGAMRGALRTATYQVGELALLNPPAAATGEATFRSYAPAADAVSAEQAALDYLYGTADQINCALRDVGTFPRQEAGADPTFGGIVAPGVLPVEEGRRVLVQPPEGSPEGTLATYRTDLALGKDGFNIPTLVGLALGGPYFHAGNARSLEEVFSGTFEEHYRNAAIAPTLGALSSADVRDLVSYLLSIDDGTEPVAVPSPDTGERTFDPDLCAQFDATR